MLNKRYIYVAALLAALVLAGCGDGEEKVTLDGVTDVEPEMQTVNSQDTATTSEPEVEETEQVRRTAQVQEIASLTSYSSVGSFMPEDDMNISSKIGGTLEVLNFDKGDVIRLDQKVAEVDQDDLKLLLENAEAQLEVAQANLDLARNEFERKKKLRDDGAIPAATFDAVATQLDLALAQKRAAEIGLKQAKKSLADTVTASPVSGVVSMRHVSAGEFIGAGDPIITVSVLNPLKLVLSVPERLAPRIAPGAEIKVTLAAYPGEVFTGEISLIGPLVDAQTRSVPIEATFDNDDRRLKPGYFAEVDVPLKGSQRQFRLPSTALHSLDGGYVVIEAESGRQIPVSVISSSEREAVVTGDLSHGLSVRLKS